MLVISSRGCAEHAVERLGKIYKVHIERSLSFGTLFNNISQRENMINTSPSSPETYLSLRSLRSAASDRCFMMTFAKSLTRGG